MQNEIIDTNYIDYIKNIEKLISKIFLNIKQIIVLLFYIFYKQPEIIRKDCKVREYIYSSNYEDDWDNYKYKRYEYWYNDGSKDRPKKSRISKIITLIIIILLIIIIFIYYPSYIKQILQILQTGINNVSTTIVSTTYKQPKINSTWVFQFFSIINQYRQSVGAPPLQYCPWLDEFAYIRFKTMIQNPAISHYGFDQDFNEYLNQYQSFLLVGEEVLYPDGYIPSKYVQYLQSNAPLHWEGLINSKYTYYGYYIGTGPTYTTIDSCPVTEIPGPNINIPQYLQSYGCSIKSENNTWLVIELSNWCSGPATLQVTEIEEYLPQQYYIYLLIQYNLPTNDKYVKLVINLRSTSPVKLFLFTPAQFNYFRNLYQQEAWSFTGSAYYYGGKSTTFNIEILLNTYQLSNGGYYLVISNVLPDAQYTYINGNITIVYTPTIPFITLSNTTKH